MIGCGAGPLITTLLGRASAPNPSDDLAANPTTRPADRPELDEPDFALLGAQQRERGERRAQALTSVAAREGIDPSWAPDMERRIAERFAHAPAGITLTSTICKTSLCIAEFESTEFVAGGATERLSGRVFLGFAHGFVVHAEPGKSGARRSVAYLAREGHSLPAIEDGQP